MSTINPYVPLVSQALCEMGTGMPPVPGQVIDMRLMMRFMGFATLPISFTMPVGTLMYWMTANVVYIAQRQVRCARMRVHV